MMTEREARAMVAFANGTYGLKVAGHYAAGRKNAERVLDEFEDVLDKAREVVAKADKAKAAKDG